MKTVKRLDNKDTFALDAYIANPNNLDEAYKYTHPGTKASDTNVHRLALLWIKSKEVARYVAVHQPMNAGKATVNVKIRSKDDIITELNEIANNTPDTKKRAEILMKIADLQQMKQEQIGETEDERIHFYLPLKCWDCPYKEVFDR